MPSKDYYVYIATNQRHTVLYVGVTNDLAERMYQHKTKFNKKSFTARYNIDQLVYFEEFDDIDQAIMREKQLKAGSRKKKIELIEKNNPEWRDLSEDLD